MLAEQVEEQSPPAAGGVLRFRGIGDAISQHSASLSHSERSQHRARGVSIKTLPTRIAKVSVPVKWPRETFGRIGGREQDQIGLRNKALAADHHKPLNVRRVLPCVVKIEKHQ